MANMIKKSYAFTGHRPYKLPWKYNEADPRCVSLKMALLEQIRALAAAGVTDMYSGMAEGVDIWCSRILLFLRKENPALRLHCILPHEGQADKWAPASQELYRSILAQADSVEYVSREYRKNCMLERNRRLVDQAGRLLAVYNGEWRGGTAATLRYARKMGRALIVIDPLTRSVTQEEGPPM